MINVVGATLGTIPHLAESTQRLVLSLPSDLELQRAIDVFRGFQVDFLVELSHELSSCEALNSPFHTRTFSGMKSSTEAGMCPTDRSSSGS